MAKGGPVPLPYECPERRAYEARREELMRARAASRRRMGPGLRAAVDAYANLRGDGAGFAINRAAILDGKAAAGARDAVLAVDAALSSACGVRGGRTSRGEPLFRGLGGEYGRRLAERWTRPGTAMAFPGFLSTSFMPVTPLLYASPTLLVLRSHGLPFYFAPREDELVLPRGTRWRLVKRYRATPTRASLSHPRHGSVSADAVCGVVTVLELELDAAFSDPEKICA